MAKAAGFEAVAPLKIESLQLRDEVRAMCADNACGKYGKCWSCPPGCGTLDECRERIGKHSFGVLVQTIGEIEDSFDGEGMMAAEALHRQRMQALFSELARVAPGSMALGAGCCSRCRECTCPDAPCRFPDEMMSSMEAYGLLVTQVCKDSGMKYYYGSDHIAYTGCLLV